VNATTESTGTGRRIELGLRQNAAQFTLLVVVNALVGGMLGQERTVLPLLGKEEFGLTAYTAGLSFILALGIARPPRTTSPAPGRTGSAASRSWWPAGWSPYPCPSR
jgi:hypothetical protein